ncbi:MAG: hypothetical protein LBT02_04425 [Rickettsiales bacterium]|jgi:hypothetical protein|nr:hypothetical protein [Rickettsiales bacterium]
MIKNKNSFIAILIGLLPHCFCCGIPFAVILINLFFGTNIVFQLKFFNEWTEYLLFAISGFFITKLYLTKDKSREERIILYITTGIFIFNLIGHLVFDA